MADDKVLDSPISSGNTTAIDDTDKDSIGSANPASRHGVPPERSPEKDVATNPVELSQTPDNDDEGEFQRSKSRIAVIMLALALACFLAALDTTIVTTALPSITAYFQSETVYTWVGSSYLLAVAATTIIWGKLSDIFGRKPVLLIANVVFFVGSLIAALSVNATMIIFGRAIQGVGGGGLMVLTNICIGDLFSPRKRGAYYGVVSGVWALAMAVGPIIGGLLTERVSWRWCFWINLPLDGLAFIIIFFFLDLKTPKTPLGEGLKTIDWVGAALSVGGTLMVLFGLSFGGVRDPWNSPIVICLIVFGFMAWIIFFLHESYVAKYPLMPTTVFYHRRPLALLLLAWFHSGAFISSTYYLPLYFQTVLGASPILSGVYLLPLGFALSATSVAAGQYLRITGSYRPPMAVGFVVMAIGFGLYIDLGAQANWALIILSQIVAGAGCGPNFQAPMIALQSSVPPRYVASATSAFAFTRGISGTAGIVIAQVINQNRLSLRRDDLVAVVGSELADKLAGGAAVAQSGAIKELPLAQQSLVHGILADGLKYVWIFLTAYACAAVIAMLLVGRANLSSDHKETETGLEAEKEARAERLAEQLARRKVNSGEEA